VATPDNREVADLKQEIKGLIVDVKGGELDCNDAAVMVQAYRALTGFIELERRGKEAEKVAADSAAERVRSSPDLGDRGSRGASTGVAGPSSVGNGVLLPPGRRAEQNPPEDPFS
jgi:hypothetical protein